MKLIRLLQHLLSALVFCSLTAVASAQCPTIEAIMVDACGTEQLNEFVVINSGAGFFVSDLQLDFDANNNFGGAQNNDINIGADPCGLQAGNPGMIVGCSNVVAVGPGAYIPPNSYVVLQTSAASNASYDFSGICGTQQCIFVISSSCIRSAGAFSNAGTGTRTTVLSFLNTSCSESYTYDRTLVSGNNGDYFIPPSTYGNAGCVAPPVSFGNQPPSINPVPNVTICGSSYVLPPITGINLSGGQAYYTGPNGTGTSFAPGATVTSSGTYYLYDGAGACSDQESFVLTLQMPITPVITGIPASLCSAEAPIALPTTQSGITGNWSGTGVSMNMFNPSGLSGNIVLTFTPAPGECANSNIFIINVPAAITPTISGVPTTLCEDAAPVALPTTQSGISGTWTGTGVMSNTFNPSGQSGSITLTFTPNPGQCANANTATINVTQLTTPAISGVPTSICENTAPITLPTTQSGVSGMWSGTGVTGNSFNPAGQNGSITLTFTPNPGQCAGPNTTSITVTPLTTPALSGVPASVCEDAGSIALPTTQSGVTGNWSGTGVTGNSFNPAGQNGSITLTFTPNPGQCAGPNTTSINVTPLTTPALSGIPASVCEDVGPITLPTTQSGVTGNWSGIGVTGNTFNPSGQSGSITLTFTPTPGQCAGPNTTTISVTPLTVPVLSGLPASLCVDAAPVSLSTTQSGITGNWTGPGVTGNTFNPSGLSGSVTLTFTPDPGQCAGPNTTSINVTPLAIPVLSGVPATLCEDAAPVALPTTQSGVTGNWSGTGVTGNSFNPSGLSGSITLTFTPNPGQCAGPNTTTITVNPLTIPALSGIPASLCEDSAPVALPTTQSGITGNWSGTGVTGNTFSPSGLSGSVTLTFTPNPGQCAGPNTTSINVIPLVIPALSGVPASICENAAPVALPTTQSGITGSWSGMGVVGNNFNPSGQSGSITLTFTPNPGQCAAPNTTTINVTPAVTPIISGLPASLCQNDGPIALPSNPGGVTGNWSGFGVTGNSFNPSGLSGNITLTFTPNPGQCASVATTSIQVNPAITPTLSGVPSSICQNATPLGLSSVQQGITGTWSGPGVSGSTFNPAGLGGVITLSFTPNPGQCANSNSTSVQILLTPFVVNLEETCDLLTQTYTVSFVIVGGVPGTYTVNGVPSGANFTSGPIPSGVPYSFGVNDVHGCGPFIVSGVRSCNCPTFAGTMNFTNTPVLVCEGNGFSVTHNGNQVLGPNDVLVFILHDNPGTTIGNLIATSSTTSFGYPAGVVFGQPYYVSPVAGLNDGTGNVDFADPCLSVSQGVPVFFFPNVGSSLNPALCPGESITVNGTVYDEGNPMGSETFPGGSFNGCDSTLTINLSFFPAATGSLVQELCTGSSITVNGTVYDEANPTGTEVFPGASVNGCDSTLTISLSFASEVFETLNPTLCPGESITVNGTIYDEGNPMGSETFPGGSFNGCDSTVTINLSFFPAATGNLVQELCTGGSITVNGTVYDEANPTGTEVFPGASVNGCDSTLTISLSFASEVFETLNPTLCPGESITVNGTIYDEGNPMGSETFPGGSFNGCDSTVTINLSFFPAATGNLVQELCTGGSITVNGTVYDEANPTGMEIFPGASVNGCDSTLTISLSFASEVFETLNPTLCPGESITVNGTVYDEGNPMGSETFPGGSFNGCDSTLTINLSFFPAATGSLVQELCTGGSITVNGTVYDEANPTGTEVFPGASVNGCDSTLTISLTFASEVFEILNPTLCPGESITVNGTVYDEGNPMGSETFPGGSFNGCDSTVTINLSFFPAATGSLVQELCTGNSITVNGTLYNEANPTGMEIFPGASVNGCDSVLTINLSFLNNSLGNLTTTLCPGESITVNGTLYNETNPAGFEIFLGAAANGCDSVLTINVSFFPEAINFFDPTLPAGGSVVINGTLYDMSNPTGVEIIPGASVNGCDSTVLIMLNFEELLLAEFELVQPVCHGDSNGQLTVVTIDGGVAPYEIRLNGGLVVSADALPYTFTGLASGGYQVLITDAAGTSQTWSLFLGQPLPVFVQLNPEYVVSLGDAVTLSAQSNVPIAVWQWIPPFNLSCADCPNPSIERVTENATYEVLAIDSSGCIGTAQTRIRVEVSREVYIPNVFSPNDDGFNDVFGIFAGRQVARVHAFRVFSRWGELVHEALNFEPEIHSGAAGGWDGRFRGQRMNPGVYVWYADIEFIDGRREVRSGDVTLLR